MAHIVRSLLRAPKEPTTSPTSTYGRVNSPTRTTARPLPQLNEDIFLYIFEHLDSCVLGTLSTVNKCFYALVSRVERRLIEENHRIWLENPMNRIHLTVTRIYKLRWSVWTSYFDFLSRGYGGEGINANGIPAFPMRYYSKTGRWTIAYFHLLCRRVLHALLWGHYQNNTGMGPGERVDYDRENLWNQPFCLSPLRSDALTTLTLMGVLDWFRGGPTNSNNDLKVPWAVGHTQKADQEHDFRSKARPLLVPACDGTVELHWVAISDCFHQMVETLRYYLVRLGCSGDNCEEALYDVASVGHIVKFLWRGMAITEDYITISTATMRANKLKSLARTCQDELNQMNQSRVRNGAVKIDFAKEMTARINHERRLNNKLAIGPLEYMIAAEVGKRPFCWGISINRRPVVRLRNRSSEGRG